MSDTKNISEAEALKMKQAAAPGAVKAWRVNLFPMNPTEAVDFLNLEPRQGPGEAAFILLPGNRVQVYYFS